MKIKFICIVCKKEFSRCPSLAKETTKFCSMKCKGIWMKGKPSLKKGKKYGQLKDQSVEAKQERSERQKGKHEYLKSKEWKKLHPSPTQWDILPKEKRIENAKNARSKSPGFAGCHHSDESNQKNREKHLGKKGKTILPDVRKKILKSSCKKPNCMENTITNLLINLFENEYEYVGNFRVLFEGKNPDWINVNGKKKIIELFGAYHHGEMFRRQKYLDFKTNEEHVMERIKHFKKFGYDTLIIWSPELKNIPKLKTKLVEFHNRKEVV